MSTLLLRLAAPMQAWGIDAKFDRRGTERVPSKSAVIGLIAAALGRRRNEGLEDLQALRFGVRVDREGTLLRDYHTAKSANSAYVTQRYYLADAVFLVGLEGEEGLLAKIEHALRFPYFPLFLGRRSCPPEGKLLLGIRKGLTLLEALRNEPWLVSEWAQRRENAEVHLRIVTDADDSHTNVYFQRDVPLSFDQAHRRFGYRRVCEAPTLVVHNSFSRNSTEEIPTQHDPMLELGEE
ncbi:MAG: type I-E CRISPR-associated protein Cas5/CasD [Firmicutes bacterium]|jgi:CRISPR system Cascade subunit CasD|nr:type I-E CRISPR-associated protein Cas5/CasD [Bacillota bacterium]